MHESQNFVDSHLRLAVQRALCARISSWQAILVRNRSFRAGPPGRLGVASDQVQSASPLRPVQGVASIQRCPIDLAPSGAVAHMVCLCPTSEWKDPSEPIPGCAKRSGRLLQRCRGPVLTSSLPQACRKHFGTGLRSGRLQGLDSQPGTGDAVVDCVPSDGIKGHAGDSTNYNPIWTTASRCMGAGVTRWT